MEKSILSLSFSLGQLRAAGVGGMMVMPRGHAYDFCTFSVPRGTGVMVGRFALDIPAKSVVSLSNGQDEQFAREGDVVAISRNGDGRAVYLSVFNGAFWALTAAQDDIKIQLFCWSASQPRPVVSSLIRDGERVLATYFNASSFAAGDTVIWSSSSIPACNGATSLLASIIGPAQALGELCATLRLLVMEGCTRQMIREWPIGPGTLNVVVPLVGVTDRASTDSARWQLVVTNPNAGSMTGGGVTSGGVMELVRHLMPESVAYSPPARIVGIATGAPPTAAPSLAADGWVCQGMTGLVLSFQDDSAATRIVGAETATYAIWWYGVDGLWHTDGTTIVVTGAADTVTLPILPGSVRFYLQETAGSDFWWTGNLLGGLSS